MVLAAAPAAARSRMPRGPCASPARVRGDDRTIECADRHAGHHVRLQAALLKSAHHTSFERTQRTASLQDQNRLVGNGRDREARLPETRLEAADVRVVADERTDRLRDAPR